MIETGKTLHEFVAESHSYLMKYALKFDHVFCAVLSSVSV